MMVGKPFEEIPKISLTFSTFSEDANNPTRILDVARIVEKLFKFPIGIAYDFTMWDYFY